MSDAIEPSAREVLLRLAHRVEAAVSNALSRGSARAQEETYLKWTVEHFEYTEDGLVNPRMSGSFVARPSWLQTASTLSSQIKADDLFASSFDALSKLAPPGPGRDIPLERFTDKLTYLYLTEPDPIMREQHVDQLIHPFVKHLSGDPLVYTTTVELEGVVVLTDALELEIDGIRYRLRRTAVSDLERESPAYGFSTPHPEIPSAILELSFQGRHAHEAQGKVEQAIAVLRLFDVGSVRWVTYRIDSESLTDWGAGGRLHAGPQHHALEKYVIRDDDAGRLEQFWREVNWSMPKSLWDTTHASVDAVGIAYQRYGDALLTNGIIERRISNAVMGLESLFLRGSERQELAYRLRTRLARLLGPLGLDPYAVRNSVSDAYTVRSTFVHGDMVSKEDRSRIENRYGGFPELLRLVLNHLRIGVAVALLTGPGKENLISLIDDALIHRAKQNALEALVMPIRGLVSRSGRSPTGI